MRFSLRQLLMVVLAGAALNMATFDMETDATPRTTRLSYRESSTCFHGVPWPNFSRGTSHLIVVEQEKRFFPANMVLNAIFWVLFVAGVRWLPPYIWEGFTEEFPRVRPLRLVRSNSE